MRRQKRDKPVAPFQASSEDDEVRQILLETGLEKGMKALDAGGGEGFVTQYMAEIVNSEGKVLLVDQSDKKLRRAREALREFSNVGFKKSFLEKIPIASDSLDYVYCRMVFAYLSKPEEVFEELLRITKPGGHIVIAELDYNHLSHYPLAPHLESQLLEIAQKLKELTLWDPWMGRKIYHFFEENKLQQIDVKMQPYHLVYGQAQEGELESWKETMNRIESLIMKGSLQLSFDLLSFRQEFSNFFENPSRFSYSPLITVHGQKE